MGWNSWNAFRGTVSDALIRETAEAMVESGMAAAGYEYVNIDDCWSTMQRDGDGRLVPDPEKFPHGIAALADHVHERGLKLGIYSSAGDVTCEGYPAGLGHEEIDAQTWADWGIDLLKYDNCGDHQARSARDRYQSMADALEATGRPIVFSLCDWGEGRDWEWNGDARIGHLWRTTYDIRPEWGQILAILDQQPAVAPFVGPGNWADPDMLQVGNPGLSDTESRAHLALWAVLNAPLITGNDLRTMTEHTRALLTNRDVIRVDQDWSGRVGTPLATSGETQVWAKPMSEAGAAVVLLNRGDAPADISVTTEALGLPAASSVMVRDVWTGQDDRVEGVVGSRVDAHDAAFVIVG